jgi:hypothetical protein
MAQKFYQKATVQVALVSGLVAIIIAGVTIWHQRSDLKDENERLVRLTQAQSAEIQRLETLLTPFRTIALEKYAGPEGEALKQLAERITSIDESLANAKRELEKTKQELVQKTSDRKLTEDQKQRLRLSLKGVTGQVIIKADFADSEAQMFANQIKQVLLKTDIEILENVNTEIISLYARGIQVLLNDTKNPPPHALPILKAFKTIGLKAKGGKAKNAKFPNNALIIWVCHK